MSQSVARPAASHLNCGWVDACRMHGCGGSAGVRTLKVLKERGLRPRAASQYRVRSGMTSETLAPGQQRKSGESNAIPRDGYAPVSSRPRILCGLTSRGRGGVPGRSQGPLLQLEGFSRVSAKNPEGTSRSWHWLRPRGGTSRRSSRTATTLRAERFDRGTTPAPLLAERGVTSSEELCVGSD